MSPSPLGRGSRALPRMVPGRWIFAPPTSNGSDFMAMPGRSLVTSRSPIRMGCLLASPRTLTLPVVALLPFRALATPSSRPTFGDVLIISVNGARGQTASHRHAAGKCRRARAQHFQTPCVAGAADQHVVVGGIIKIERTQAGGTHRLDDGRCRLTDPQSSNVNLTVAGHVLQDAVRDSQRCERVRKPCRIDRSNRADLQKPSRSGRADADALIGE